MLGTRPGAPKRLDTVEIIVPFVNGSRFIIPCLFILVVLWRLSCFVFFLFICFYLAIFFLGFAAIQVPSYIIDLGRIEEVMVMAVGIT